MSYLFEYKPRTARVECALITHDLSLTLQSGIQPKTAPGNDTSHWTKLSLELFPGIGMTVLREPLIRNDRARQTKHGDPRTQQGHVFLSLPRRGTTRYSDTVFDVATLLDVSTGSIGSLVVTESTDIDRCRDWGSSAGEELGRWNLLH